MLPDSLLQKMLGTEFFCRVASRTADVAVLREAKPLSPGSQRTPVAVGVDRGD
jgi:hypothetical protein